MREIANRYAGTCRLCGGHVPAGAGVARKWQGKRWELSHHPARLVWDTTQPGGARRVGGCPEETEGSCE